jgi:hypothetical protein
LDEKLLRDKLKKLDSIIVLNYIRSLIEIIANHRAEIFLQQMMNDLKNNRFSNDHEQLLINAEANIRNMIKMQHQYKLKNDSLKSKIEEFEKLRIDSKLEMNNLLEVEIL